MYFERAVKFVLDMEGGYVNNPKDPGGETKYGISKRAYPKVNIKALTLENAKKIYKDDYWKPIRGNEIFSWPLVLALFDFAVNSGVDTAIRHLQMALGVTVDGDFGPKTMAVLTNARRGGGVIAQELNDLRLQKFLTLAKNGKEDFLLGWLRRLMAVVYEGAQEHV